MSVLTAELCRLKMVRLFMILCAPVYILAVPPSISQSRGRYLNYSQECDPYYQGYNQADHNMLLKILSYQNIPSVWLNIQRFNLYGWKWFNNERFRTEWNTEGFYCGLFRVNDQVVEGAPCTRRHDYIMCQHNKSVEGCPINITMTCHELSPLPYYLVKRPGSWYEASDFCYKNNDILASVPSAEYKATLKNVSAVVNGLHVGFVDAWVGLRRNEFKYNMSIHAMEHIRQHFWGTGSPCICPYKKCVILNRTRETWQMEDCGAQHHFICQPESPSVTAKIITKLVTVPNGSTGSLNPHAKFGLLSNAMQAPWYIIIYWVSGWNWLD